MPVELALVGVIVPMTMIPGFLACGSPRKGWKKGMPTSHLPECTSEDDLVALPPSSPPDLPTRAPLPDEDTRID